MCITGKIPHVTDKVNEYRNVSCGVFADFQGQNCQMKQTYTQDHIYKSFFPILVKIWWTAWKNNGGALVMTLEIFFLVHFPHSRFCLDMHTNSNDCGVGKIFMVTLFFKERRLPSKTIVHWRMKSVQSILVIML